MAVRFSLIYPTRHRPEFVKHALRFLEKQKYQDFEVIVSDNYLDPNLSCETECGNSPLNNLKYVRPPKPVGMVENWNYALQFATGDYICYFTDKMFLLPGTLSAVSACIDKSRPEIVNWVDNSYSPKRFPDYFGEGFYRKAVSSVPDKSQFIMYDPLEELSKKGRAQVSRSEQDKSHYARGKICFGAYSVELSDRIVKQTGNLFHNISPDYSSMILGLSLAKMAIEIAVPGIVHVSTDLSSGGQGAIKDQIALRFLMDLENHEEIIKNMMVPGLYSCSHNSVSHDYITLKNRYDLKYEFDRINWLVYITEDLDVRGRIWSSPDVEKLQRNLLRNYIESVLSESERREYFARLGTRARVQKRRRALLSSITLIKPLVPKAIIEWGRAFYYSSPGFNCSRIEDILC